jgi:hypothetical protein
MGSDAAPDDVSLSRMDLISVFKGCATIRRPTHLPDAGMPLHPLDPETRVEALLGSLQVGDELPKRS